MAPREYTYYTTECYDFARLSPIVDNSQLDTLALTSLQTMPKRDFCCIFFDGMRMSLSLETVAPCNHHN